MTKRIFWSTCIAAALSSNAALALPTTSVTVGGVTYELTTEFTSYTASSALLESQPWWGDAALAGDLAAAIDFSLGDLEGNNPAQAPIAALLGYGTLNGFVSIQYMEDFTGLINCPSGCPDESDVYAYVIAALISNGYTLEQAQASIHASRQAIQAAIVSTNTLVNGAHSRPLSRRVAVGEKTFWAAGDWGKDKHGSRDGSLGLTEVGGGHNFGPAQVNISLGKTWAKHDLINNGEVDADGAYIMLEGIMPIEAVSGVYTTLGAYYHRGDVDISRSYLNGGATETSFASPDSQSWGLRARIDWENAFNAGNVSFSPYADLWYNRSKLNSYTETGGSFPARFEERKDSLTELRVGLNSTMPIQNSRLDFIANLEAVHRFDSKSDNTHGEVVGLFSFDLDGQDYEQNWFKAGIGIEGDLEHGKANIMLNGTTEGEMPNAWLAASYQLKF